MPTYAKSTTVSASDSRGEIERTLQRYGAGAFMYGWEGSRAVIGFEVRGLRYRMILPLPDRNSREFTHTAARGMVRSLKDADVVWEQATRQRWRAMALWIKAVLEAAEAGITTLEIALQPYVVLPNGLTAGEWLAPQIQSAYESGHMPPMLPAGG
ncbi:MAG: hypothetical protein ACYC3H_01325 [Bellilinea sp.]